jgi:hypothetical protein
MHAGADDRDTAIICLAFRNTGSCRFGDECKYAHISGEPIPFLPSWLVSNIPPCAVAHDVSLAFVAAMGMPPSATDSSAVTATSQSEEAGRKGLHTAEVAPSELKARNARAYETVLHARGGNSARPYAHVTAAYSGVHSDAGILENGIVICGVVCAVKRRREAKRERVANEAKRMAEKQALKARQEARRGGWKSDFLSLYPSRGSTLDQHAQVSSLEPDLQKKIELYLLSSFSRLRGGGGDGAEAVLRAFKSLWETCDTALRVKELFETVESFKHIYKQVAMLRARADELQRPQDALEHIFDLACGHGLLGVLLAHALPRVRVTCVDLQPRPTWTQYHAAFSSALSPGVLTNLTFVQEDLALVDIPAQSLVLSIHACNDANRTCIEKALDARAAYALMPCCIRNGIYDKVRRVRHLEDDARHALMVGVIAATYKAHAISAIDRRITNRNLLIFGGFPFELLGRGRRGGGRGEGREEGMT